MSTKNQDCFTFLDTPNVNDTRRGGCRLALPIQFHYKNRLGFEDCGGFRNLLNYWNGEEVRLARFYPDCRYLLKYDSRESREWYLMMLYAIQIVEAYITNSEYLIDFWPKPMRKFMQKIYKKKCRWEITILNPLWWVFKRNLFGIKVCQIKWFNRVLFRVLFPDKQEWFRFNNEADELREQYMQEKQKMEKDKTKI